MNGVLGMAHYWQASPTREQQEYIDAIKISANNLMVIINDILDFSKINAGKIEFSETEFNLRDLVKGIVQILQVRADEKKIQIGCTLDYHIKDNLIGDPIRLNQILVNLMGNAVKFTEKKKLLWTSRSWRKRTAYAKVRFRVTDSGIGIRITNFSQSLKALNRQKITKKIRRYRLGSYYRETIGGSYRAAVFLWNQE